jgi:CheY-like chemotaxis protein
MSGKWATKCPGYTTGKYELVFFSGIPGFVGGGFTAFSLRIIFSANYPGGFFVYIAERNPGVQFFFERLANLEIVSIYLVKFKCVLQSIREMNEKTNPNILVAEDVESNFLYIKAVLSKLNATIFWAKSGVEAIEICERENSIDLVFMDLQMPEMNGYEATQILKKKFPNLPIVAQTAFAMSDDREKALDSGCDDYLAKPIKSKDLLSVVEKYVK